MAEGSDIPAPLGASVDVFEDDPRTEHARALDDRKFTINFGPQHPAAHGVLRLVVADLDIAGHREDLAQRISLEAIVGQQPAQVRMAREQHAVHVERLALEPVGARINAGN